MSNGTSGIAVPSTANSVFSEHLRLPEAGNIGLTF